MRMFGIVVFLLVAITLSTPIDSLVPTAPQVWYQKGEIHALVHFNMATFVKDADPGIYPNIKINGSF